MKRLPLFISFTLFIALSVSLAYWALQLFKPPLRPIAPMPAASTPPINIEAAATLFGGQQQANTAVASNVELKGIIDAGRAGDSVAILAANGDLRDRIALRLLLDYAVRKGALRRVQSCPRAPGLGPSPAGIFGGAGPHQERRRDARRAA